MYGERNADVRNSGCPGPLLSDDLLEPPHPCPPILVLTQRRPSFTAVVILTLDASVRDALRRHLRLVQLTNKLG